MSKARVAIAKDGDPVEMAKAAMDLAGIGELCRDKTVLIKANLSGGPSDQKGAIVSRETTKGVLEYLKPFCKRLALGDGARFSADYTKELFEKRTFAKSLTDELGIELVNLWEAGSVTVKTPKPLARPEWTVAKAPFDFEVIGTLPVLKVNGLVTVTLGMKNLYSFISYLSLHRLHPWVKNVIVDINQIYKPSFCVIDGFWGWEGGEAAMSRGQGVSANVVIAGKDVVATDAVGTMLVGRDPTQIDKLRLANQVGLGVYDPKDIEILGVPLEKARMNFVDVPLEMRAVFKQETIDAGIEAMMARP